MHSGRDDRVANAHDAVRVDAQLPKELPVMIAEVAMPPDTQSLQCARSLDTGDRSAIEGCHALDTDPLIPRDDGLVQSCLASRPDRCRFTGVSNVGRRTH